MIVSGVQQSDLVIHVHVSIILFQILIPFRLLENTGQSTGNSPQYGSDFLQFSLLLHVCLCVCVCVCVCISPIHLYCFKYSRPEKLKGAGEIDKEKADQGELDKESL